MFEILHIPHSHIYASGVHPAILTTRYGRPRIKGCGTAAAPKWCILAGDQEALGATSKVMRGIYLTGFSGSGKSTIAQLVGARLGCPAFDLDQVIVERSRMTIPTIFAREGEAGFRMREAEVLRALTGSGPFVIAAGGGTPVRPENRRFMAERGWIICLEGRPETLLARVQHQLKGADPNAVRPMLNAVNPLDQIRALKHSRQSAYALADWTVHTDRLTPQQVAEEIIHAVEVLEKAPPMSLDGPIMPICQAPSPDLPRPCVETPVRVRGKEYGGAKPLFCTPLVAADLGSLLIQAETARGLGADLVEWRADSFHDASAGGFADSLKRLRSILPEEPIIFTLRIKAEGGAREMPQDARRTLIEGVAATGLADIIDLELCNERGFIESVVRVAHENGVRIILSFHDFEGTPANEELLAKINQMNLLGADIAKIAVTPQIQDDALRLLEITLQARRCWPRLPLCTTAMGRLGILTRVAGFLFGSDMAYAAGQESSAPGQIPIADARAITEGLLKYTDFQYRR